MFYQLGDAFKVQYYNGMDLPNNIQFKDELWNAVIFLSEWITYRGRYFTKRQL